ncbi:MAG TPA: hypothetical protein VG603_08995 [Chitinophagales bacterium]|nr:hypothetical protein [Chitinophagales bacterium]
MKRKTFIKSAALTAAGSMVVPYILPSGRLFAATGSRKANHVVFCLFAGGVRNIESMQKADGNLMTNTLNGNESISSDISGAMTSLPQLASTRLQNQGTLYQQFSYANGPTGHFNGHTTALTGKYTDTNIQIQQPPQYPTIFEYYRKHNSPTMSALNAWWICDQLGPYPYLNYSLYDGYGPNYGANMLQPGTIFSGPSYAELGSPLSFSSSQQSKCDLIKTTMNGQFKAPTGVSAATGIQNTPEDQAHLQTFINTLMSNAAAGTYYNTWGVNMDNDMYNILFGIQVLQEFKPELMVINMTGIDIGHFNFTQYVDSIRKADYALYKLWEAIQSTPGMAGDTVLIVAPEHGRNQQPNSEIDTYGRYGLDHTNDNMSREIFCLIVGPSGVVKQGQVFTGPMGESVDIVPTIGNILGFDGNMPLGMLDGTNLSEAFV